MLIDKLNMFSDEQAITADAVSTNVIDVLPVSGALNAGDTGGPSANTTIDIAAGTPLYLHVLVTTAMVSSGSATLTIALESDDTTDLSTSPTVHLTVVSAVAAATMVAGYWLSKGVPIPVGLYQRYVGLRYTTNTSDFQTGKISAWLSNSRHDTTQYRGGTITGVN